VRDWIVPINKRYPLADLMATLRELYPLQQQQQQQQEEEEEVGSTQVQAIRNAVSYEPSGKGATAAGSVSGGGVSAVAGYVTTTASARQGRRQRVAEGGTSSGAQQSTLLIAYTMLQGINDTAEDAHRCGTMTDQPRLPSWCYIR
jgi:hypothetical protein